MRSRIWAHKNQSGGYSAGVACYHVSGLGKVAFKGFCVSLLIRRQFSLRLRSRAEWSGVPPEAEVGEAESRNKTVTLGKSQFYIAEISTERSAVCLCVVCLQCFYWLNNGVFLQYYTVKLRYKRELTTKQPTSSEACELLVSVPDCILTLCRVCWFTCKKIKSAFQG